MKQGKKKHPFKKHETGYHKHAVMELAEWVRGVIEKPFFVNDKMIFVPDVTVERDGIVESVWEVTHTHPVDGKKLGMIQYWCYMNNTSLTVYEISAKYILAQTEKPDPIRTMECFTVDPFENCETVDIEYELVESL